MGKGRLVNAIKSVIREHGTLTTSIMEMNSSPVYNFNSKDNFSTIERFNLNTATVVTYVHEMEVDSFEVTYDSLDYDLLTEILNELETYSSNVDR